MKPLSEERKSALLVAVITVLEGRRGLGVLQNCDYDRDIYDDVKEELKEAISKAWERSSE
jgi:hypothetical protein